MEGQKDSSSRVDRFLKRVGGYFKGLSEFAPRKIPLEEINQQTISVTILYNILAEGMRLGDRSDISFSAADILPNLGYGIVWAGEDYREKFPAEYAAVRRELDRLVKEDTLVRVPVKESDLPAGRQDQEMIYYQVVNKEALTKIATRI